MTILSGTGSRDLAIASESHQLAVYHFVYDEIKRRRPETVISGAAEGFDHTLALAAFAAEVPVTLAIPSPDYGEYYWERKSITGENRKSDWQKMIQYADKHHFICSWNMKGRANFIRNQWMVDFADEFLIYKPFSRGTSDCVKRIVSAGKPSLVIEIPCPTCGEELHYNGAQPHCETCTYELCDSCFEAEENTWD